MGCKFSNQFSVLVLKLLFKVLNMILKDLYLIFIFFLTLNNLFRKACKLG